MAELNELEHRLIILRGELAEMARQGCTTTQFLKLQRDLVHAWAAVEDYKSRHRPMLPALAGHETPAELSGEVATESAGSSQS